MRIVGGDSKRRFLLWDTHTKPTQFSINYVLDHFLLQSESAKPTQNPQNNTFLLIWKVVSFFLPVQYIHIGSTFLK